MTRDREYSGWTNYETWLVKLWIDNDRLSYRYVRNLASWQPLDDGTLAAAIKFFVEEVVLANRPTGWLMADLLTGALAEVNWQEIAKHVHEEVSA